jgi:vancomycin permeability regulator SanA
MRPLLDRAISWAKARPPRWWLRRAAATAVLGALLLAGLVGGSVAWVHHAAGDRVYSVRDVPKAPVAMIFGAEVYADGNPSPYLAARLRIGQRLLATGKVRALLLTGDHGRWAYDEPGSMARWLVARGVPRDKLALDYAGFDTYQSCARGYRIFGVRRAILVNQDFSITRSLALCRSVGIDAVGVADTGQRHNWTYLRGWTRDQLADVKAVYCMTAHPDPRYLGRREHSVQHAVAAR